MNAEEEPIVAAIACFDSTGNPLYVYRFHGLDTTDFLVSPKKISKKEIEVTIQEAERNMVKWTQHIPKNGEPEMDFPPTWVELMRSRFGMRHFKVHAEIVL